MDRTKLFVAVVKTIRLKERDAKSNLEKLKAKPTSLFLKEAQELHTRIRKLQEFLVSSRMVYIDAMGFLGSKTVMNDDERDQIDIEVKEFLQACMSQANRVKNLIANGGSVNESVSVTLGSQLRMHRTLVCESLDDILKVNYCYSERDRNEPQRTNYFSHTDWTSATLTCPIRVTQSPVKN